MFSASRALSLNAHAAAPLPYVPELADLYKWGCTFRRGQVMMIAGRSGTQKSGFAMWLVRSWNLPTLYFAGDMNAFESSSRFASMLEDRRVEEIEEDLNDPIRRERVLRNLQSLNVEFCYDSPIAQHGMEAELEAYVELHNKYPEVIVIDNFMDLEGCESDYAAQMAAFQSLTALAQKTGATMLVLHHATDKGEGTRNESDLAWPPSRREIKNGMSEKPQLCLTVGLDSRTNEYRIAVVKQRMGRSSPSAGETTSLLARPEYTKFERFHKE